MNGQVKIYCTILISSVSGNLLWSSLLLHTHILLFPWAFCLIQCIVGIISSPIFSFLLDVQCGSPEPYLLYILSIFPWAFLRFSKLQYLSCYRNIKNYTVPMQNDRWYYPSHRGEPRQERLQIKRFTNTERKTWSSLEYFTYNTTNSKHLL